MPTYIDLDKIKLVGFPVFEDHDGNCLVEVNSVRNAILQTPVEDVQNVVHAHWIFPEHEYNLPVCSHCGMRSQDATYKDRGRYCSSCGAKMDENE